MPVPISEQHGVFGEGCERLVGAFAEEVCQRLTALLVEFSEDCVPMKIFWGGFAIELKKALTTRKGSNLLM